MSKPYYFQQDDPEFFFRNETLFKVTKSGEVCLFRLTFQEGPLKRWFNQNIFLKRKSQDNTHIFFLVEYENNRVVILIEREGVNPIICFNKDTGEIYWTLGQPRKIANEKYTSWVRIFKLDEFPNRVYCRAIEKYMLVLDVSDGHIIEEAIAPRVGDARDF